MPNYLKGKIYKLICDDPELVYYGSTTQKYLSKRLGQHRELKCSSKEMFLYGNVKIILIENYPCSSRDELVARERWFIENNNCINKRVVGRTTKEYRKDKAKERNEYNRQRYYKIKYTEKYKNYYEENYKKQNEKNKVKVKCSICHQIISKGCLKKHKQRKHKPNFHLVQESE